MPTTRLCEVCALPCPEDLPYCSFDCHCRAEGWHPDEIVTLAPLCTICQQNSVDAENGYDTCAHCLGRA